MSTPTRPRASGRRRQRALSGLVLLFALWLVFDGTDHWIAGVTAAALAALLAGAFPAATEHPWHPFRLPGFVLFFLLESFRGGIDVAWRSLHPDMPVQPVFFDHPMTLPEGAPSTLLISVISLLPGTLSAELRPDRDQLVVHALTEGGAAAVERLQQRIGWLFDIAPMEHAA